MDANMGLWLAAEPCMPDAQGPNTAGAPNEREGKIPYRAYIVSCVSQATGEHAAARGCTAAASELPTPRGAYGDRCVTLSASRLALAASHCCWQGSCWLTMVLNVEESHVPASFMQLLGNCCDALPLHMASRLQRTCLASTQHGCMTSFNCWLLFWMHSASKLWAALLFLQRLHHSVAPSETCVQIMCSPAHRCCGIHQRSYVDDWKTSETAGSNGGLEKAGAASSSTTEHPVLLHLSKVLVAKHATRAFAVNTAYVCGTFPIHSASLP